METVVGPGSEGVVDTTGLVPSIVEQCIQAALTEEQTNKIVRPEKAVQPDSPLSTLNVRFDWPTVDQDWSKGTKSADALATQGENSEDIVGQLAPNTDAISLDAVEDDAGSVTRMMLAISLAI
jgi:hypothetical protein